MDAKVGDRISLDAKKVGQARRTGSVRALVQGLSGVRYEIAWDDGSVSVISPGAGVLLVEGRAGKTAKRNGAAKKPAPKPKKAATKPKPKKAAAKPKKAAAKPKKAAKSASKAKKTAKKAKKSSGGKRTKSR